MNWMPNLLAENFHVENSVGILISILAPIATVVGPIIAIFHCERHKNFIVVGLIYMIIAMVLVFALIFTYNLNIILCVALSVIFLVIVQGVITMIFSVVSIKMGAYVNTGAHASLMNAAGGFSAGFAPTIVGAIIDSTGWQISYVILTIFCIAVVISLAIIQLLIKSRKS
jgi:sugar phosphate permease